MIIIIHNQCCVKCTGTMKTHQLNLPSSSDFIWQMVNISNLNDSVNKKLEKAKTFNCKYITT